VSSLVYCDLRKYFTIPFFAAKPLLRADDFFGGIDRTSLPLLECSENKKPYWGDSAVCSSLRR
jgi:hypothetical protein